MLELQDMYKQFNIQVSEVTEEENQEVEEIKTMDFSN